ncbi:GNAT family N-acetyltransferase [Breoghania sp.]|uniref:GNAT family N-acetyltransferase n=1 Tax=Breoghania sp. TaxID=2065378 RepID=UPI002AABA927|nr:GNAT family N-acetyltransferase [Breoghania sp.]
MATTEAEAMRLVRPDNLDEVFALEQANLTAFPSEMLHFDGAWLTRLSPGNPARRVNSLNIYDPGDDQDAQRRLACAVGRFAEAGIDMHLRWTPLVPESIDALIDAQGWQRYALTEVWSAPVPQDIADVASADEAGEDIVRLPLVQWLADFAAVGGTGADKVGERALAALRASLERVPADLLALSIRSENGEAMAVLLGVCDGDLIGIFDVATAPAHRRKGLAGRLVRAALAHGAQSGARTAWLQVVADNMPARGLYADFGFKPAYQYHYCRPPGAG